MGFAKAFINFATGFHRLCDAMLIDLSTDCIKLQWFSLICRLFESISHLLPSVLQWFSMICRLFEAIWQLFSSAFEWFHRYAMAVVAWFAMIFIMFAMLGYWNIRCATWTLWACRLRHSLIGCKRFHFIDIIKLFLCWILSFLYAMIIVRIFITFNWSFTRCLHNSCTIFPRNH